MLDQPGHHTVLHTARHAVHHSVRTVDGFTLAAQTSGSAAGRPLLLLAGQANDHHWWDDLRARFEGRFAVITLDWRGTGDSRGQVSDWSTPLFAEDAAAVLEHLSSGPALVYSASMGGRVAQHLAAAHPELVDRLVLACTSPGGEHAVERDATVRRALADPDAERRRATMVRLFYTDAWQGATGSSHLLGDPTMTPREARAHLRASNAHDAWDVLSKIRAATLVLHGTEDQMVPLVNARLLAERIPGAQLLLHEGGRHGFFEEFADVLAPTLDAFWAE